MWFEPSSVTVGVESNSTVNNSLYIIQHKSVSVNLGPFVENGPLGHFVPPSCDCNMRTLTGARANHDNNNI